MVRQDFCPIAAPGVYSTGGGFLFFVVPEYSICFFWGRGCLLANLPYCVFKIFLSIYNKQILFH